MLLQTKHFLEYDFYHAAIVGSTQSGKSYLAHRMLEFVADWIAIDPDGDYTDIANDVFHVEPLDNDGYSWEEIEEAILLMAENGEQIRVSIVTSDIDIFSQAAGLVYQLGYITFLVDEAHEFITPHKLPPEFSSAARRGAKRGVHIIAVSQRHTELNTNYLSQCNLVIAFHYSLPRDIEFLERCTRNKLDNILPRLKQREYIAIHNDKLLTF